MKKVIFSLMVASTLFGCAHTDIQPLTKSTFKVATKAAPACGPQGAREIANKAAAIEVIKRGGDKFIFLGDESGSTITGISGGSIYSRNDQSMVVKMMTPEDPNINEALSAREILGPKWVEVVAAGIPTSCSG